MPEPALRDRALDGTLGVRRADVLARLRQAAEPLGVAEIAELTGLHVNTARFHLDGLVTDGFAVRTTDNRGARGRPRVLYAPRAEAPGPRSYRLLAEMLIGVVASQPEPRQAAIDAGREWGRHLVERAAPSERPSAADAAARLNDLLAAVGFEPTVRTEGEPVAIDLRHCPFREVAERHTDVVCALHLGLMQGALAELRAPLTADALQPFVTPTLCIAHLAGTGGRRAS